VSIHNGDSARSRVHGLDPAAAAVQVADGALPIGVRERVPVLLVIPPDRTSDTDVIVSIPGRVVGLPTATTSALGLQSLSVEVASGDAATVAAADDVRVALLEPTADGAAVASARPEPPTASASEQP